ncbi:MAG TPA: FUSC family protein [Terriglobales bacterium]|jgi:hypothetical protein|nr:FUSC family protein [Terriglobales bacterium]
MLRTLAHDTIIFDWTKLIPKSALRCLPAIAIPLIVGISTGHPRYGLMAAAGAFTVGFGTFQELRGSRTAPLWAAAIGMCVSSWIGSVAGHSNLSIILISALWGFLYGTVWNLSPSIAWTALQCVIWLVISTAYPQNGLQALERGTFMLLGGLLQIAIILIVRRVTGKMNPVLGGSGTPEEYAIVSHALGADHGMRLQAFRAAIVLAVSAAAYRYLALPNGYWIPMTAAIVMRPTFVQTFQRGLARILGTLAGAVVATVIASLLRPQPWILVTLVLFFVWACFMVIFVNYALFAICLTAYVVFVLALAGLPETGLIAQRTINTLLGGGIAWIVHTAFAPLELFQERMSLSRSAQ